MSRIEEACVRFACCRSVIDSLGAEIRVESLGVGLKRACEGADLEAGPLAGRAGPGPELKGFLCHQVKRSSKSTMSFYEFLYSLKAAP